MIYDGLEGATELEISVKEILYRIEVLSNLRKKAVFLTCDSYFLYCIISYCLFFVVVVFTCTVLFKPAFFCLPFHMINTTRQANPNQYNEKGCAF